MLGNIWLKNQKNIMIYGIRKIENMITYLFVVILIKFETRLFHDLLATK